MHFFSKKRYFLTVYNTTMIISLVTSFVNNSEAKAETSKRRNTPVKIGHFHQKFYPFFGKPAVFSDNCQVLTAGNILKRSVGNDLRVVP